MNYFCAKLPNGSSIFSHQPPRESQVAPFFCHKTNQLALHDGVKPASKAYFSIFFTFFLVCHAPLIL